MRPRAGTSGPCPRPRTLAFVESPVQLLNVLEWAYAHASGVSGATGDGAAGPGSDPGRDSGGGPGGAAGTGRGAASGAKDPAGHGAGSASETDGAELSGAGAGGAELPGKPESAGNPGLPGSPGLPGNQGLPGNPGADITLVVLAPTDPMTRGQLRRMSELARNEGYEVRWEEARGGATAPFQTVAGLTPLLRAADRVVMGDPFSRYVQLLLTITRASDLVVVDDGTATMEFVSQLARGERLVRWHRKGGRPGPRDLLFAPVASAARNRLTPGADRHVEVFSSMPIDETPEGVTISANDFAWTRARFGPPRITKGADLVGTSLVETGVVDGDRYLEAVRALARAHGAARYFAHRRESSEKLHRLAQETGLEVVRPDLPLELIARRGPIGRTILSFPSTVVHTLPLALAGTDVKVAVCDIDPAWLTRHASPRAQGFLAGVTTTARDVHRLSAVTTA
ncbi:collagen-like triple helix repeat-containing protein [Streptomyces poonensis]|uniref:Uncharacterized protein n=1 Tax=Streptomyces poonensis TaxID=68255 RepID=A0A918UDH9_9ACTN|nr:collagen-like protein [Streptomyces poonensis]GGY91873.1 hypothetical protein GCM10010365_07890 [Streptomyces poonensis]GLJ87773.1 hypothetical protein GCM10017589_03730 [Streptomyces poonensis]